ncbi:MAG: adenylyltransferase/cytidyltransferase family protein [Clostridia bacterium]|nr:adenylyltransferase/cytidyltransferase family protein [Clostridia bacterium]
MSEKEKVVVFMGSFNPPHYGHLLSIDRILAIRKELHLFVRYNEGVDLTSRDMKMKWFEKISADRDHRVHVHMFSTDDFKGKSYTGNIFASFIRLFEEMLDRPIDEVWVGEDGVKLVEATRDQFPNISFRICERVCNSTAIREDFEGHKDWLPDFIREDLARILKEE